MASTSTVLSTTASSMADIQNSSTTTGVSGAGTEDPWASYPAPKVTVLTSFIVFGLVGNILILVTIFHTKSLRTSPFYVFVVNHAIVNILECLLNMTVVVSVTILGTWNCGDILCNLSSSLIQTLCIESVLSMAIIACDRTIAVRFRDRYEHMLSMPRVGLLIGYTWFQSAIFSVPIVLGAVPSDVDENIFYCTISAGASVIFLSFAAFFCFLIPVIVMVVFYVYIIRTSFKERFVVRALLAQNNYNEATREEPKIHKEFRYSKLSGTLFVVWLFLVGPNVVTSYFSQFQFSSEIHSVEDEVTYTWHVDLVLIWLRFTFVLALPVCAVLWDKELWKSFKDLILCRKHAMSDGSNKQAKKKQKELDKKLKEEEKMKEVFSQNNVFQVPVLFATSQGVHIQTYSEELSETEVFDVYGNIRGKKCDVIGSHDNLDYVEDDTSDYDSGNEMDPFSVSHPVSIKHLQQRQQATMHERSSSQPEVRERKISETFVSSGDSGLDLTSSHVLFKKANSVPVEKESTTTDKQTKHKSDSDSGVMCHGSDSTNGEDKQTMQADGQESYDKNTHKRSVSDESSSNNTSTKPSILDIYESERRATVSQSQPLTDDKTAVHGDTTVNTLINEDIPSLTKSPNTKRKKKKRRELHAETTGSVNSSPVLPPRPPPRLAPILSSPSSQNLYTDIDGRPCSRTSFSSQCSILESNNLDGAQRSLVDINNGTAAAKSSFLSELTPIKKRSKRKGKEYRTLRNEEMALVNESFNVTQEASPTGSMVHSRLQENVGLENNTSPTGLTLDCSSHVKAGQDAILTPSECLLKPNASFKAAEDEGELTGITNFGYTNGLEVTTEGDGYTVPTLLTALQYRNDNSTRPAQMADDDANLI